MAAVIKLIKFFLVLLLYGILALLGSDDAQPWTLDDFEDGDLTSASGASWIVIADDLGGGATVARLEAKPGGVAPSRQALRLAGRLGGGQVSFAGAWAPLERSGRNLDLSAFDGIRLRVKGPARLDVGFRSGPMNFMARVEAGPDWKLVDIPFAQLAPTGKVPEGTKWDPRALQVFGVTTPQVPAPGDPTPGDITFEIDDVTFYSQKPGRVDPVASGPATGFTIARFANLAAIPAAGWTDQGADPARDGRMPSLPDAVKLETIASSPDNVFWARVSLREPPHDRWMGVNLLFDVDGDPANGFAWWGANTAFKFDRIVTVWCFQVAKGCQGYIGVADAAQAAAGTFVAGGGDKLRFAIDRDKRAFVVGVPRELLNLQGKEIRLVAAVGSALLYADDVPGQGAATIR